MEPAEIDSCPTRLLVATNIYVNNKVDCVDHSANIYLKSNGPYKTSIGNDKYSLSFANINNQSQRAHVIELIKQNVQSQLVGIIGNKQISYNAELGQFAPDVFGRQCSFYGYPEIQN